MAITQEQIDEHNRTKEERMEARRQREEARKQKEEERQAAFRQRAEDARNAKGHVLPCASCGHPRFTTLSAFVDVSFTDGPRQPTNRSWTTVGFACNNCGLIRFHLAQMLGLPYEKDFGAVPAS